ncbi:hypothetical protein [Dongia deserti]|uniref:hypothetical protein n=1 Tax=Dongia deserti TaxID=2268030 RepID=UPI000E647560|nr:hypothetical protein [Dongia deserti]
MGTKNNPGDYDCYAKAHADEPMFTLLGRDRTAHHLVAIWSALRGGHFEFARQLLDDAIADLRSLGMRDTDKAKLAEAATCSEKMKTWFDHRNHPRTTAAAPGPSFVSGNTAPSAESETPKSESTGTPSAARATA